MPDELSALYGVDYEQRMGQELDRWLTQTLRPTPQAMPTRQQYEALVEELAPQYGQDPMLVKSMIQAESAWNPHAVSKAGAQGIAQLMPGTARRFGVQDPFDPQQAIPAMLQYLKTLTDEFGDPMLAVAAYNAGEGAVRQYKGVPPYQETMAYVRKVFGGMEGSTYTSKGAGVGPLMSPAETQALREQIPFTSRRPAPPAAPPPTEDAALLDTALPTLAEPGMLEMSQEARQARTYTSRGAGMGPETFPAPQRFNPYVPGGVLESSLEEPTIQRVPLRVMEGTLGTMASVAGLPMTAGRLLGLSEQEAQTLFPQSAGLRNSLRDLTKAFDPVGQEENIVDRFAQTVGQQLVFFGSGAAVAGGVNALMEFAPALGRVLGTTVATVQEAGIEAQQTLDALTPILGEREAARRANTVFWRNMAVVGLTNKLGIFSEAAMPAVMKVSTAAAMEGFQEVAQYDIGRREFWVDARHPLARQLQALGWKRHAQRVYQPFEVSDAAEAGALGAIIGGVGRVVKDAYGRELLSRDAEQKIRRGIEVLGERIAQLRPSAPEQAAPPGAPASDDAQLQTIRARVESIEDSKVRDDEGRLIRMYHGTAAVFQQFTSATADPHALYGPGMYFTDSPDVASGYAGGEASVVMTKPGEGSRRSIPEPGALYAGQTVSRVEEGPGQDQVTVFFSSPEGANVDPVYLDIKHPFDMDGAIDMTTAQRLLAAVEHPIASNTENLAQFLGSFPTGEQVYRAIAARLGSQSGELGNAEANQFLQEQGYDGITHTGGAITGGPPHRVYIAFSPEQVTPAFDLEAHPWFQTLLRYATSRPSAAELAENAARATGGPGGASALPGILSGEGGALGRRRDVIAGRGAGAIAAGHNRIRAWTEAMGDQVADLTPEDRREAFERSKAIVKEHVQAIGRNLPTTEELLKYFDEGKATADWYAGAMEELRMHFGDEAELVAKLIAATSPQTRPVQNIQEALRTYAEWKTGARLTLKMPAKRLNVERVLAGGELSGEKVNNFARNIMGDPGSVTADIWMMRMMGLVRPGSGARETPSPNQYRLIEEWTTQLAEQAGVSPREMQAALWVGYKLLHPIAGEAAEQVRTPLRDMIRAEIARRGEESRPVPGEIRELLGGERGAGDIDLMVHLAMSMAGGLAGCLRGETTEDCLVNAVAGAGLGVISSASLLRYLRRNLRTFSRLPQAPGGGPLLQQSLAEVGTTAPREAQPAKSGIGGGPHFLSNQTGAFSFRPLRRLSPFPAQPSPPPRGVPSLQGGAQGLPASQFRDEAGRWRIPLRDMPSQELEIQDFVRQQLGIQLEGEELRSELLAIISRKETGISGLQNNPRGMTLQQIAEKAHELGFTPTADKEAFLDVLGRSVNQGQFVYSHQATGYIPLVQNPTLQGLYQQLVTLAETSQERIEKQRRGTIPRAETHRMGREMVERGDFTVDDIQDMLPGMALNPETASAMVQQMSTMAGDIAEVARAYLDSGTLPGEGSQAEQDFLTGFALLAGIQPQRLGALAEAGRTLGALNDPLSPINRLLNELTEMLPKTPGMHSRELAQKYLDLFNTQGGGPALKWGQRALQPSLGGMLLELYYQGMMSSPKTWIVNEIGNASTAAWALPVRFAAAAYSQTLGSGEISLMEPAAYAYGLQYGIRKAWQEAAVAFKTMEANFGKDIPGIREPIGQGKVGGGPMLTAQNLRKLGVPLDPNTPMGKLADFWFTWVGLSLNVPGVFTEGPPPGLPTGGRLGTRIMTSRDEFYKFFNYFGELAALAYRKAAQAQSLDPTVSFADTMARILAKPLPNEMHQAAAQHALVQTLQNDLAPGSLGAVMAGFQSWAPDVPGLGPFPLGRLILPFLHVARNVPRYALENSALGFFFKSVRDDIAGGGARADMAAGKILMGSLTAATFAIMASHGMLTGRGPEDKDLRAAMVRAGWQPYSVFVPWLGSQGGYLSLQRIDPIIGQHASIMADVVEIYNDQRLEWYEKITLGPLYALVSNIGSRSYMRGLSDFFDLVAPRSFRELEGESAYEGVRGFVRGLASSLTPAVWGVAQKTLDPATKLAWDWADGMRQKTPGWAADMPNYRNKWGDKRLMGWGWAPDWLNWIEGFTNAVSPLQVSMLMQDPLDRVLLRDQIRLSMPQKAMGLPQIPGELSGAGGEAAFATAESLNPYATKTLPLKAPQYEKLVVLSSLHHEGIRELGLEVNPRAVDLLYQKVRAVTGERLPADNPGDLYNVLLWATTTKQYQDGQPGPQGDREEILRRIDSAFRAFGREQLLANDAELRQRYMVGRALRELQQTPISQRDRLRQRQERTMEREEQRLRIGAP